MPYMLTAIFTLASFSLMASPRGGGAAADQSFEAAAIARCPQNDEQQIEWNQVTSIQDSGEDGFNLGDGMLWRAYGGSKNDAQTVVGHRRFVEQMPYEVQKNKLNRPNFIFGEVKGDLVLCHYTYSTATRAVMGVIGRKSEIDRFNLVIAAKLPQRPVSSPAQGGGAAAQPLPESANYSRILVVNSNSKRIKSVVVLSAEKSSSSCKVNTNSDSSIDSHQSETIIANVDCLGGEPEKGLLTVQAFSTSVSPFESTCENLQFGKNYRVTFSSSLIGIKCKAEEMQ